MTLNGKEIVEKFYTSSFYKNPHELKKYLHPDVQLFWHSSTGYSKMDYVAILAYAKEMSESYEASYADIERLIQEENQVAIHFTYFVKTIENPDEELPLANFMVMWEIKDDMLFKGFQISQPAEDIPE